MGNIPYSRNGTMSRKTRRDLRNLPEDAEFVVHLGGILSEQQSSCSTSDYADVQEALERSPVPLFIIPGDNDWYDCPDQDRGWTEWKDHFLRFDELWSQQKFLVQRQPKRKENFSFYYRDVLFIGLHIVGGIVKDEDEWRARHRDNFIWTRKNFRKFKNMRSAVIFGHASPSIHQGSLFSNIVRLIERTGKQVMYIHGDGQISQTGNLKNNSLLLNVEVDMGAKAPPLKVTANARIGFQVDRRFGEANKNDNLWF